jgi:hypothetical protein
MHRDGSNKGQRGSVERANIMDAILFSYETKYSRYVRTMCSYSTRLEGRELVEAFDEFAMSFWSLNK